MQSSINVDYDSIFSGNLGNREPVIKVKIQDSDDPRDTLIRCIFTPTSKYEVRLKETGNEGDVYIIYAKNRYAQVCDLWSNAFLTLIHTLSDSNVNFITSNDELYFERQGDTEKYIRSKGCKREEINFIPDSEIIKLAVNDFVSFTAIKNGKK